MLVHNVNESRSSKARPSSSRLLPCAISLARSRRLSGSATGALEDVRRPTAFSEFPTSPHFSYRSSLASIQIPLNFTYDDLDSLSSEQLAILTFPDLHAQPPDPFVAAEARALLMRRRNELERETGLKGQGECCGAAESACTVLNAPR